MGKNEFSEIISNFQIEGEIINVEAYGSGHIHETFRLKNKKSDLNDYLLQKINTKIFKSVSNLMSNIQLVTSHLRKKVSEIPGSDVDNEVLTLILTTTGQNYYAHDDGSCWRMYLFLKGTQSYDLVENEKQAYEGGTAYGRFQSLLADLDASRLYEILPDFHNINYRLNLFQEAIDRDPFNRVKQVGREIDIVRAKQEKMMTILKMGENGLIPLKTTHNDTKFNNVLLNQNNVAQCVIDLDTIMPGYVAYDFGDAIRTIVNTATEDEKDLVKIGVDMQLFESFTKGFIREANKDLCTAEIESLAHGCLLLPFLIGLRFLTDHIDGDNYFRIHFPGHNRQRARSQFRLAEKIEEQFPRLQSIIYQIYKSKN